MVDFGESDKMIEISGKMDESDTYRFGPDLWVKQIFKIKLFVFDRNTWCPVSTNSFY